MDIIGYRSKIDSIDKEIVRLFEERLEVCDRIAEFKKKNDLPICDEKRECEKIALVSDIAKDEADKELITELFKKIMELSKRRQEIR